MLDALDGDRGVGLFGELGLCLFEALFSGCGDFVCVEFTRRWKRCLCSYKLA